MELVFKSLMTSLRSNIEAVKQKKVNVYARKNYHSSI